MLFQRKFDKNEEKMIKMQVFLNIYLNPLFKVYILQKSKQRYVVSIGNIGVEKNAEK